MLRLIAGNLNYSSWTLRPWLALKHCGAAFELVDVGLRTSPGWKERITAYSAAGKVPVLQDGSLTLHESLAICEYLAELFPKAGLWPQSPSLRALGRSYCCEMLSGFTALRTHLPMNLRGRRPQTPQGDGVLTDVQRAVDIWSKSLALSGGPFLLGDFSIADCMFFPLAARFRTYGVSLSGSAAHYSERLFARPDAHELEALAKQAPAIPEYDLALS